MSKTRIVAKSAFTVWDGEKMVVFNPETVEEIPSKLAQDYIDAGMAEEVTAKRKKGDPAPAPAQAGDTGDDTPPA